MNINELATASGVTTRTIRYYVEQELLPNPEYGYPAQYTTEHLQRLALIRRLKEEYLPLDEIKTMLQGLNADELAALLTEHTANPPPAKAATLLTSAGDYINQVLGRGAVREQMKQNYAPPAPAPTTPPPATTARKERAASAVPPTLAEAPFMPPAPPAATAPPPAPAAMPIPALSAPASEAAIPARWARGDTPPGSVADEGAQPAASRAATAFTAVHAEAAAAAQQAEIAPVPAAAANDAETWRRIVLWPGIELHIAVHEDRRFNRIVARLLEAAHRILAEEPEKAEDTL